MGKKAEGLEPDCAAVERGSCLERAQVEDVREYLEKFLADDRVIEIQSEPQPDKTIGNLAAILGCLRPRPPLLKWLVLQAPCVKKAICCAVHLLVSLVGYAQALLLTRHSFGQWVLNGVEHAY